MKTGNNHTVLLLKYILLIICTFQNTHKKVIK